MGFLDKLLGRKKAEPASSMRSEGMAAEPKAPPAEPAPGAPPEPEQKPAAEEKKKK